MNKVSFLYEGQQAPRITNQHIAGTLKKMGAKSAQARVRIWMRREKSSKLGEHLSRYPPFTSKAFILLSSAGRSMGSPGWVLYSVESVFIHLLAVSQVVRAVSA